MTKIPIESIRSERQRFLVSFSLLAKRALDERDVSYSGPEIRVLSSLVYQSLLSATEHELMMKIVLRDYGSISHKITLIGPDFDQQLATFAKQDEKEQTAGRRKALDKRSQRLKELWEEIKKWFVGYNDES